MAKFLEGIQARLLETLGGVAGDLLLLVADTPAVAATVLGRLRVELARPVRPDPAPIATSLLGSSIFPWWSGTRREAVARDAPSVHRAA